MGNNYSSVSTRDDSEVFAKTVLADSTVPPTTFVRPPIQRLPIHTDTVNALAIVRPGMVVTGSADKTVVLNNIDNGDCVMKWSGHEGGVTKVMYKLAGAKHYVLSGSRDAAVKLWSFHSPTAEETFVSHSLPITGLASVDDMTFLSGSRDCEVKLFDINRKEPVTSKFRSRNLVTHMVSVPHSTLVCQTAEDRVTKIWDTRTLSVVRELPLKAHIQYSCAASSDGTIVITASGGANGDGCEITMYDVRMQKELRLLRGHEEAVKSLCFLPQTVTPKKLLLSIAADKTIRIWTVDDGKCIWKETAPGFIELTSCISYGDGNVVVAGSEGSVCHLKVNGRAGTPFLTTVSAQSRLM